jgi:hypothetical protein
MRDARCRALRRRRAKAIACSAAVLGEMTLNSASPRRPIESSARSVLCTSLVISRAAGPQGPADLGLDLGLVGDAEADGGERGAVPLGVREMLGAFGKQVGGGERAGERIPQLVVVADLRASWLARGRVASPGSRLSMGRWLRRLGDLVMKSFAPAVRARLRVSSSSLPEMTRNGSSRMRGEVALRMRASSPKPSSLGIERSEMTATIVWSWSIAVQASSPSCASRGSNETWITLEIAPRTTLESSTISTRGLLSTAPPPLLCPPILP